MGHPRWRFQVMVTPRNWNFSRKNTFEFFNEQNRTIILTGKSTFVSRMKIVASFPSTILCSVSGFCQSWFWMKTHLNLDMIDFPKKVEMLAQVIRTDYSSNQDYLTISWRRPLSYRNQSIHLRSKSYRNQSIHLRSKSMDWFLYDNGPPQERVKESSKRRGVFRTQVSIYGGAFLWIYLMVYYFCNKSFIIDVRLGYM